MNKSKNVVCTTCGMTVSNSPVCPACGDQLDNKPKITEPTSYFEESICHLESNMPLKLMKMIKPSYME